MRETHRKRSVFRGTPGVAWDKPEDQWFDRKSIRVAPSELARHMIKFANADGGTIVVGVEDDLQVTGVDQYTPQVNGLRQASLDHTGPPVRHAIDLIECIDRGEAANHLLVIEVHPSDEVLHRDKKGDAHLRIGDATRRLTAEQARQLTYDKGVVNYDAAVLADASLEDLDETAVDDFAQAVGLDHAPLQALRARGLVVGSDDRVTHGAMLLFGRTPQAFFPNAGIRILRYEGTRSATGTRSNVVFDRRLEGTIPFQIEQAEQIMLNQLRQLTRLDERSGRFVTIPELPRFAWLEAIVNATTHRSYSLHGDHIRVSIFDDRVEISSPGRLPGPVRIDNIRETRFSRNPRIARALADIGIVRELNEGMRRIYEEMTLAGLPDPQLKQSESGFLVTLFNDNEPERAFVKRLRVVVPDDAFVPALDHLLADGRLTTTEAATMTGLSTPTVRRRLTALADDGLIERVGDSPRDPTSYWKLTTVLRGRWKLDGQ